MSSSDSGKPWWEGDYVWRPPEAEDVPETPRPSERKPPREREREWERDEEAPAPRYGRLVPCWRCGKRVEEGERACPYCGASFAQERPKRRSGEPRRARGGSEGVITMIWFFVGLLGVSLMHGLYTIVMVRSGPITRDMLLTLTFFAAGIDTVLVLVALRVVPQPLAPPNLTSTMQGLTWAFAAPAVAAMLAVNIGYHQFLRTLLGGSAEDAANAMDGVSLMMVLLVCVQPAIIEELFFRHLALGTLRRQMNLHAAVLVSSVMFAAAHIHAPISMPVFVLLGMGFGYIRLASGNIILPMIMHFLHNLAVLFMTAPR